MNDADDDVDVSGMSCPMPLITLSQSIGQVGAGKTIRIVGDDPIFEQGVRDYCEMNHHQVVSVQPLEGRKVEIVIRTVNTE